MYVPSPYSISLRHSSPTTHNQATYLSPTFSVHRLTNHPPLPQSSIQQQIDSLETHRVNTLTELCRIERAAAACENEEDSRAFQAPMTQAWTYYVTTSGQFLTELRGLSRNYPFCAELVSEGAPARAGGPGEQPELEPGVVVFGEDARGSWRKEMWQDRSPTEEEAEQLAQCFEYEWTQAVDTMLRHWPNSPTWY
ncbi:hypothetical protein PG997_009996 [Apiospora hydei]|uniref:Uncharacterized protein n=1 Tax=Apiospora hydei TaxID=1337664 RepID=A0ABR1VZQ1_9PEZI